MLGPGVPDRPLWFRSEMAVAWTRWAEWMLTVTTSHLWSAHTVGFQVVLSSFDPCNRSVEVVITGRKLRLGSIYLSTTSQDGELQTN